MKTKSIIFIMLILFALPKITAFSQNRNVVWVHGFGGDASRWERYANLFTSERKINSTRQSYNTTSGLETAAAQLRTSVPGGANYPSNNMGIGHSMGGVMIREVDRMPIAGNASAPKKFGGFITVASPNYGAPISENILNNNVQNALATGGQRLLAGPIAQMGPGLAAVWEIISGWTTQKVINVLNANIEMFTPATNNDLKENSQKMTTLNNFNSTVHRINIIAEETSPVHWRISGSGTFGAGSSGYPGDELMVTLANQIREAYQAKYIQLNVLLLFGLANEYKKGRDWLDDSQTIWCNLIKSSRLEQQTYWQLVFVPCNKPICKICIGAGLPPSPDNPIITGCGSYVSMPFTQWVTVTYKNDGLLPIYAQELKGVPAGSNRYYIDHANHFEVRNMQYSKKPNGVTNDATKNVLNDIFNRENTWWHTPRKTP